MTLSFIRNVLLEGKPHKLTMFDLPYDKDSLSPVISKETIDYHYGKLAKGYVERYNNGEGDATFNEAGAYLHEFYFNQFYEPNGLNKPDGLMLEFINKHFTSFDKFKEEFEKAAMGIQGSGWVYLSHTGKIKTITNHAIKTDIILLIDWWEHAWALDYQADKKKYLENQWKIINWGKVYGRITDPGSVDPIVQEYR